MSTDLRVAIAGATGSLGFRIFEQVLAAGYPITVLTRKGSSSTSKLPKSSQVTIKEVDYTSVESLTEALKGVYMVISTLGTFQAGEQNPLIDAAVAAGVSRFIPSEFGSDTRNKKNVDLPTYKNKIATEKYLMSKVSDIFSYTLVYNNVFLDWAMEHQFILQPATHSAVIYDGGDKTFSTTTLPIIGKAIVGILRNLNATKNREVRIHATVTTQNKLLELCKRLEAEKTGEPVREWTVTHKTTDESMHESYAELQKENPQMVKAMRGFLPAAVWADGHGGDFSKEGNLDNELLGIEELSPEEIEKVVAAAIFIPKDQVKPYTEG